MSILTRGTRLGPYEVTEAIGAGGMGEVYRATDTRLRRDVAIKLVAERWQEQPNLRSRFLIEAEAIAKLNHPNICQIYDIGSHGDSRFIVMEVVDGETLAARLSRGPLPIDQACKVAAEIAGALGAAHRAGIVHRDIKPANVILSRDGAKLLDFGLAQLTRPPSGLGAMESTTGPGETAAPLSPVGTWHYMSPEQIRGEATDARSDVFALGALMYELVAGRRAFNGATHQELVAAILAADPVSLETAVPAVPDHYARIVRICLSQAAGDRWNSAADVRLALDASRDGAGNAKTRPIRRAGWWTASAAAVAFAAGLFMRSAPASLDRNLVRSMIDLGAFEVTGMQGSIVFTPDGKSVIYASQEGRRGRLYRYSFATGSSEPIEGTEGGRSPFVSPDGQWLAFEAFTPQQQLVRVPIGGGRPVPITSTIYYGGYSWGDDGFIAMSGPPYSGLLRVSADGGTVYNLTTPRPDDQGKDHRNPVVLPGSRTLLYAVGTALKNDGRIVAEDLRTGVRKDLVSGATAFRYAPSGHIVYARDGVVFAQQFDVSALAVTGAPVKIADGVIDFAGVVEFAVSASGDLIFVPGDKGGPVDQMVLTTPAGEMKAIGPPARVSNPKFSPSGTSIAVIRDRNVWLYDLVRDTFGPVTFDSYLFAIWGAQGGLTLSRGRPALSQLVDRPLDAEAVETAITPQVTAAEVPIAWVDGGRRLLFERHSPDEGNIWSVEPGGRQPKTVVVTPFNKNQSRVSPDGRWLSYTSAEAGESHVYLQRLDIDSPRVQASRTRGSQGVWSPNSDRLYFYAPSSKGKEQSMWSVTIGRGSKAGIGPPIEHFETPDVLGGFDMSPNGKQFVMVRHLDVPIHSLGLVQNWITLLDPPGK